MSTGQRSSPAAHGSKFLPSIHGLRGFSALFVFYFHIHDVTAKRGFFPYDQPWVTYLFGIGAEGVKIFFMISGYLITSSLISHANAGRFLLDRVIRIYPVFFTIHLILFIVGPIVGYGPFHNATGSAWALMFIQNLLFMPGVFNLPLVQLNAWTLSYEALFYLVAATIYVTRERIGKQAAWTIGILISAPFIWFYPSMIFFPVGAFIYFISKTRKITFSSPLALLSLVVFLGLLIAGPEVSYRLYYLAVIPGAYFFWCVVANDTRFAAFFRSKFLMYAGTISYSFYLLHPFALYAFEGVAAKLARKIGDTPAVLLFACCSFALAVLISHISNQILEKRLASYLKKLTGRRKAVQPAHPTVARA